MTLRNALGGLALDRPTANGGGQVVGNARTAFRDGFVSGGVDPNAWYLLNEAPDAGDGQGHIVNNGGDSFGSSYLRISLSPFLDNSTVWLSSKAKLKLPMKVGYGVSISQRIQGQEVFFGVAEADDTNAIGIKRSVAQPADIPITGANAVVVSNVATITASLHGLKSGDRVVLLGCTDRRANVGPVQVTVVDINTFTVPMTQANASYSTVGGSIRVADPLSRTPNAFGLLAETTSVTNASLVARRNGGKYRIRNSSINTTGAVQGTGSPYADALLATSVQELFLSQDECSYRSWVLDSATAGSTTDKFGQGTPDDGPDYRLHLRVRTLDDFSKPVARITSISKTGTTTATVVTDRPHGFIVGDQIGIYGVRDQTNFVNNQNLAVASVIDTTTFTTVVGIAVTNTNTQGGVVWINHGGVFTPGAINYSIQQIQRTSNVLSVTLNAAAGGFIPGEYLHIWGMTGGGQAYEGAYKTLRQTGSVVEVESFGPDFGAIITGGAVIRRTDVRLHFARVLDHTRHYVEVLGGRGNTADANNAVPVAITASTTTSTLTTPRTIQVESSPLTTTVLTASNTFTMTARDAGANAPDRETRVRLVVQHTAGQVHGHLTLEQSTDNATFRETHRYPIPSDASFHTVELPVNQRYWRVKFINGTTAQTSFYLSYYAFRGESAADEAHRNLTFLLTPAAGQAAAISATTIFPTLDLGVNHLWNTVRLWAFADQAGTVFADESLDGTTWRTVGVGAAVAAGSAIRVEQQIATRFLRLRHVNGTTAATNLTFTASLVSL